MENKINIKKLFFVAIVLLLITWTASVLLFWLIEKKDHTISLLIGEINEQTARREEIRFLARDTRNLRNKINELDRLFIGNNQKEIVVFIEDVETIADISGTELVIDEVQISSLKDEVLLENFENVDLRLEVEGSWVEVFHFLNLLENLPRHITFEQNKISLASDSEDTVSWKGHFNFSVSKIK